MDMTKIKFEKSTLTPASNLTTFFDSEATSPSSRTLLHISGNTNLDRVFVGLLWRFHYTWGMNRMIRT
jgi:hypothetical protein